MTRTRVWRRYKDYTKARRKRMIDLAIYHWRDTPINTMDFNFTGGFYKNLHKYSKNKIHCSCPLCSAKTNRCSLYGRKYNPTMMDWRKDISMEQQEQEFDFSENL